MLRDRNGALHPLAALELEGGAIVSAQDGLLALPDDRGPEASIDRDQLGRRSIEREDGSIAIAADQMAIATRRGAFRLMLPVVLERAPAMTRDSVAFRFGERGWTDRDRSLKMLSMEADAST